MAKKQFNFEIKCVIETNSGDLTYRYGKSANGIEIHFNVPFSSEAEKNISEITLYNILRTDFNRIKAGNKVRLYAGYHGDVGLLVKGTIYRATVPTLEDADTAYVLKVLEGQDYSKYKKLNLTFANGTHASDIVRSVVRHSKINLNYISLKTNKKYKDGYTADDHPMSVLDDIASDCKSSLFYLRGQLTLRYVYDGQGGDEFSLNYNTGLIESPTRESRDDDWVDKDDDDGLGKFSWNVSSMLNYRITTFSNVHIKTPYVNARVMVLDGEHSFDGSSPTTTFEGNQK